MQDQGYAPPCGSRRIWIWQMNWVGFGFVEVFEGGFYGLGVRLMYGRARRVKLLCREKFDFNFELAFPNTSTLYGSRSM
jgi:hypothetical protein